MNRCIIANYDENVISMKTYNMVNYCKEIAPLIPIGFRVSVECGNLKLKESSLGMIIAYDAISGDIRVISCFDNLNYKTTIESFLREYTKVNA